MDEELIRAKELTVEELDGLIAVDSPAFMVGDQSFANITHRSEHCFPDDRKERIRAGVSFAKSLGWTHLYMIIGNCMVRGNNCGFIPVKLEELLRNKHLSDEQCRMVEQELKGRLPDGSMVSVSHEGHAHIQLPLYVTKPLEEKNIITIPVEGLSQQEAAQRIREVAEGLKNKIFKKSESKCPKCGETNRMASHLIGQDDPDVFHRICIRCKHEWDTREAP